MAAPLDLRAVVGDDGDTIRLASYRGANMVAIVELDPMRAVQLAGELAMAAARHLAQASAGSVSPPCRRGRRSARTVAELRSSNCALGRLRSQYFADLGITRAADEIAAEGMRYETTGWRFDRQKALSEIGDERRRLLAEVLHGRKHFPGSRRVREVLGK